MGHWYATTATKEHRKGLGQYLTPLAITDFMASLFASKAGLVRILDPGAGAGVLCCALCESLALRSVKPARVEVHAYEADTALCESLGASLAHAGRWLEAKGIQFHFTVRTDDFVLQHAESLDGMPRLFRGSGEPEEFDAIIANPPYFKIPKSDRRAQLASAVVHGQPNIYALFMAISAALLKPGGELVFITPRSFASGPYFRLFRERLFGMVRPTAIHLFGSRTETFSRDEVLQESIILAARRDDRWFRHARGHTVKISSSDGVRDLGDGEIRRVPLSKVLHYDSPDKVLHIPISGDHEHVGRLVRSWPGNLRAYGLEISTGPVVAFRAAALLSRSGRVPATHAPLLWMQNVRPMEVLWPVNARGKEQYIRLCQDAEPLLVPNRNYVLLRRFSAKEQSRRLVVAPFLACKCFAPLVGLENHLNYIHRPGGTLSEEEGYGLASLLNSALIDVYFRTSNGNTQVSATELRAMPLPPLEAIVKIGRQAMHAASVIEDVDAMVADLCGCVPNSNGHKQPDYVED
jgi:adenine-specific DNA-methyltransferase